MPVASRLEKLLGQTHSSYKVLPHSRAYTAQEVAQLTHVHGKHMVKAVIIVADGQHIMLAVPASAKVDLEALRIKLGAKEIRLAEEREFSGDFPDCEIGAMPPLGNLYGLRLIAAEPLKRDAEVVFNAGNHLEIIRMKEDEWEKLAQPEWANFTLPAV